MGLLFLMIILEFKAQNHLYRENVKLRKELEQAARSIDALTYNNENQFNYIRDLEDKINQCPVCNEGWN